MNTELHAALANDEPVAICCKSPIAFDRAHRWALARGRTSFLVPVGDWNGVAQMRQAFPKLTVVSDAPNDARLSMLDAVAFETLEDTDQSPLDTICPEQVAVVFTSGSTGTVRPFIKTAAALGGELGRVRGVLGASLDGALFVSTVPLEHTFGYSFAWWLPIFCGARTRLERVVTPNQLRLLSEASESPLWIITTPTHMKHCVELGLRLNNIAGVVCATSPLSTDLARRGAACYGVAIAECYGSTETGTIAFRFRNSDEQVEPPWKPLSGATLTETEQGHAFSVPHLPTPVLLGDTLNVADGAFHILGRSTDMIKVCGKRHSLAALNQQLATVAGVVDAIYFLPDATSVDATMRPSALVELRAGTHGEDVLAALRGTVDDLFLPRPLIVVDQLPRSESGKLRRDAVMDAYRVHLRAHALVDAPSGA